MIIFWTLAGGLLALTALFVIRPLLRDTPAAAPPSQGLLNLQIFRRRVAELEADLAAGVLDRSQYDAARKDLERELLHDLDGEPLPEAGVPTASKPLLGGRAPILALILALGLPVAAIAVYLKLGDPGIIPRLEAATAATGTGGEAPAAGHDGPAMPDMTELVAGLAKRMEQNPDNLEGWMVLGQTYLTIGETAKAAETLAQAYRLAPENPAVLTAYAEALAANADNKLQGRPAELIRAALALDPNDTTARWLLGVLDYQQDRFTEAAQAWEVILGELDPTAEEAEQLRQMIAEARAKSGPAPASTKASPGTAPPPAAAAVGGDASKPAQASPTPTKPGPRIQVSVSLAPELAAKAGAQDTVFVFARAAEGSPMPLAVTRLRVADLPAVVTLDEGMAIVPTLRLSAYPSVVVGARISKTGEATPGAGDLEGQSGPVNLGEGAATAVTVDRVRP